MLNLLTFLFHGDKDREWIWADCAGTQWVTLWLGRLAIPCEPFCNDRSPSVDSLIIETSWSIHQMYVMPRVRLMMGWTVGDGSIFVRDMTINVPSRPTTWHSHSQPTQPTWSAARHSLQFRCWLYASIIFFSCFVALMQIPLARKFASFFSTRNGGAFLSFDAQYL